MTPTTWDHFSGFVLPFPGSNLSLKLEILLQHYTGQHFCRYLLIVSISFLPADAGIKQSSG